MRIAIITSGFARDIEGDGSEVERDAYLRSLVAALQGADRTNDYTLYVEPRVARELPITAPNFRTAWLRARAPISRRIVRRALRRPIPGGHVPDPAMVRRIDSEAYDVVHFPLQIQNPWGVRATRLVTFHELEHEFFPDIFIEEHLRARRQTYRPSAETAHHIIAVSEYVKRGLLDRYRIPSDRVSVIYRSCDGVTPAQPINRMPPIADPYFLYPAPGWPHNNHSRLLEAFARVSALRSECKLVLVGIEREAAIREMIRGLRLDDKVILVPWASPRTVARYYTNAIALVHPSLSDSSLTELCRATALGCPILASRRTAAPELLGNGGLYFDPMQPSEIADAMLTLISHPNQRESLIHGGRARLDRLSASAMALETVRVYETLAAGGHSAAT